MEVEETDQAFLDMAARLRKDEKLMAELIAQRNPARKTSWWETPSFTSALVAVVSMIVGATATIYSQRDAKMREFALAERATIRKERTDVLSGLHKLVALVMKSTEDRLDLAKGNLDDLDQAERIAILDSTNLADDKWREQKESNDFLIPYYFAGDGDIVSSWSNLRDTLQAYASCAESTYVRYSKRRAPKASCLDRESASRRNIDNLWKAVNRAAGIRAQP